MEMYNPPHPGEFIAEVYLLPFGLDSSALAARIGVATSTLDRILKGTGRVTPAMAERLAKSIGRSPESWLAMQSNYDHWTERQTGGAMRVAKS
jgi:addiction module HigA family antidote